MYTYSIISYYSEWVLFLVRFDDRHILYVCGLNLFLLWFYLACDR